MAGRTQVERTAATVDALVDATLESLATVGFHGTSTRKIADHAGVSQGALQHHFSGKAQLIDAAVNRLMVGILADAPEDPDPSATNEQRLCALLDSLWEVLTRKEFGVVFELLTLARTDPETAELTAATLGFVTDQLQERAARVLPDLARRPGFRDDVDFVVGALRDAALLHQIGTLRSRVPEWSKLRAISVRLLAQNNGSGPA